MQEIYIVRHGSTELNERNVIIGRLDVPLSKKGILQVQKTAKKLEKIEFDIIYSSTLLRAKQTTSIIKDNLRDKTKVKYSSLLQEIDYGAYSGKDKDKMQKEHSYRDFSHIPLKGESIKYMSRRIERFLKQLSSKDKKILIVTHAGCMRAIYAHYAGVDLRNNTTMKTMNAGILHCKITKNKNLVKFL